ncbi:MAG: T9SS type A sorting domain-containing protein [Flavobacteriaceae bacterium]|nr:T9SS type A sorting domain-containing protein [Flavobacteriaceae bacterium]
MKKSYWLLFFLFSYSVYSQEYLPMLNEDHVWGVHFDNDFSDGHFDSFTVDGIEIINNQEYYQVWVDGNLTNCRWREDNGIVYRLNHDDTETILINFHLEVDDRLLLPLIGNPCYIGPPWLIDNLTVLETGTEFILGEERKVMILEGRNGANTTIPYLTEKWIEGIGSTRSITGGGYGHLKGAIHLACFKKDGQTLFFNDFNECEDVLSVNTLESKSFSIVPNPISHNSQLQIPSSIEVDEFRIYTMDGRQIERTKVITTPLEFNRMNYQKGVYLCLLLFNEKVIGTTHFVVDQ